MANGTILKNLRKYKQLVLVCGKNKPRFSAKENWGLYFRYSIKSVEKQFNNPIILETREITNNDGIYYTVVLEQQNKKYKV